MRTERYPFAVWETWREELNEKRFLSGLLILSFLLRLPLLYYLEIIHSDGAIYIQHAQGILNGDWTGGKAPPAYPFLIALFHLFIPDPERAGVLASILFGSLLVIPAYYLGREIFDKRTGVISSLLAAFHPFLLLYSGSVLTESTYYFLVALIALTGWHAFQKGRTRDVFLFSFLTSLAYLTRPEGIGFLIVLSAWVMLVSPTGKERGWTGRFGIVLTAILFFFILSGPYLLQIRQETGRWGITKKFAILAESPDREEGGHAIESFTKRKEIYLLTLVKNPLIVLKKVGLGFFASLYRFQQAFHPLLFLLALLAWCFFRDAPFSRKGNLYLFAYFFFFLGVVLPLLWIARRYSSHMIPVAMPWAAFGFGKAMDLIAERVKRPFLRRYLPTLLLSLFLIGLFTQGWSTHMRDLDFQKVQKNVGLWMKSNLPRGQKMMSRMPQESFYAGQGWVKMPETGYKEILEEARLKGVRYLVVDERIHQDSPGFLEKALEGELKPLLEMKTKKRFMIVYEILDRKE